MKDPATGGNKMKELKFTIYQEPRGKKAPHHTKSGITYSSKEQRYNADALMSEMIQYRPGGYSEPITDPVILDVRVYFPVPTSKPTWWKEAALAGFIQHTKKPDDDNCRKQIADCLQTLQFIKNDSQIFYGIIKKEYSKKPRWEITIKIMPNITREEWSKK